MDRIIRVGCWRQRGWIRAERVTAIAFILANFLAVEIFLRALLSTLFGLSFAYNIAVAIDLDR